MREEARLRTHWRFWINLFRIAQGEGKFSQGKLGERVFFRGNAALFGGLAYRFGNFPLKAIIEYESDDYSRERRYKSLTSPSALNYALEFFPQKNHECENVVAQRGYFWGYIVCGSISKQGAG